MVSKASDDLPDPDTPVTTVRVLWRTSISTFLRLWTRAPRTTMLSVCVGLKDIESGPKPCWSQRARAQRRPEGLVNLSIIRESSWSRRGLSYQVPARRIPMPLECCGNNGISSHRWLHAPFHCVQGRGADEGVRPLHKPGLLRLLPDADVDIHLQILGIARAFVVDLIVCIIETVSTDLILRQGIDLHPGGGHDLGRRAFVGSKHGELPAWNFLCDHPLWNLRI